MAVPTVRSIGYKLINWRLFWEFAGGNCAENMVHQIAWIMTRSGAAAAVSRLYVGRSLLGKRWSRSS